MPFRRRLECLLRDQQGVALVEMALVTPFMLLLSAGVFEFSNILHTRLLLEAGVEDAARYIARCDRVSNEAACWTAGKYIAVTGSPTAGGTARVSGWATTDVTVSNAQQILITADSKGLQNYRGSGTYVYVVQVSTTYSYSGTGLWAFLGFGALPLTVSHQERVMGS
jgi:Flp pilus assembly protein TadG